MIVLAANSEGLEPFERLLERDAAGGDAVIFEDQAVEAFANLSAMFRPRASLPGRA